MAPKWLFDAFIYVGLAGATATLLYAVVISIYEARRGELWHRPTRAVSSRSESLKAKSNVAQSAK